LFACFYRFLQIYLCIFVVVLCLFSLVSSMSLTNARTRLELADFSCAVVLKNNDDDDDDNEMASVMSQCLPAQVVPPEVCKLVLH